MAKELMDENQQPCIQQELFLSTRGGGGKVKAENFIGLVQVNHLLLQQLMQILVLQHSLHENGQLQKYGDQKFLETLSKFAIFSM